MEDLTRRYDYQRLLREEMEEFDEIEVDGSLKLGGALGSDCWKHYWQRFSERIVGTPFASLPNYLNHKAKSLDRELRILSLGSGYCGWEIEIARALECAYRFTCMDLNGKLFTKARELSSEQELCFDFEVADMNFMELDAATYDLIYANASIHHVINIDHAFREIAKALRGDGIFQVVEVVGKNGRLIWEDNEAMANGLLNLLPQDLTRGSRVVVAEEYLGMECLNAEAIQPALREHFEALVEIRHGAFMRWICTHGDLSNFLDPQDENARPFLDFLIDCDDSAVQREILRPLELWGVYAPKVQR